MMELDNRIKTGVVEALVRAGAWEVRITSAHNKAFSKVAAKRHPKAIWQQCRSIVVFNIASPAWVNNIYFGPRRHQVDTETHLTMYGPDTFSENFALRRMTDLISSPIKQAGIDFLREAACQARNAGFLPLKIAAVTSGLAVYGRSGISLHPELGSKMTLAAILTDAILEPDNPLEDFNPCEKCRACVQACPGGAYSQDGFYPQNWNREKCQTGRELLEAQSIYCHSCRAVCPAGTIKDEDLFGIKAANAHHVEKLGKSGFPKFTLHKID